MLWLTVCWLVLAVTAGALLVKAAGGDNDIETGDGTGLFLALIGAACGVVALVLFFADIGIRLFA